MIHRFYMPTKVIIGENCVIQSPELFKSLGNKALLVTGTRSAKLNGAENDVFHVLEKAGISWEVYDKVMNNPTIDCVYEGAELARSTGADFIISAGGGSPMDAAKAIALLAAQDIKREELFSGVYGEKVLPMAFIPTTAGTGSEATRFSILTNDAVKNKSSITADCIFPDIAFLDAKYMQGLSIETTINTAVDALSHAVEGMLSVRASFITDTLAEKSIRMFMEAIPTLRDVKTTGNPADIHMEIRKKLLFASFLAGMVIAQTGTTAVHAMGYSLTYFKKIDHGRANGLLMAAYLEQVEREMPALSAKILSCLGLGGISELKEILDILLGEKEKMTDEEITEFSKLAFKTSNIANCVVKPEEADLRNLFIKSFMQ